MILSPFSARDSYWFASRLLRELDFVAFLSHFSGAKFGHCNIYEHAILLGAWDGEEYIR